MCIFTFIIRFREGCELVTCTHTQSDIEDEGYDTLNLSVEDNLSSLDTLLAAEVKDTGEDKLLVLNPRNERILR